jgi:hypothetical protein
MSAALLEAEEDARSRSAHNLLEALLLLSTGKNEQLVYRMPSLPRTLSWTPDWKARKS